MLSIRSYSPGDAPVLLEMFLDTIRRVNSRDYSPEQIRAWASDEISLADWSNRFSGRLTMVAELDERLVGFADLEPNGHIDPRALRHRQEESEYETRAT